MSFDPASQEFLCRGDGFLHDVVIRAQSHAPNMNGCLDCLMKCKICALAGGQVSPAPQRFPSTATHEGFDALGSADEVDHHEHADDEQHRLEDMCLGFAEPEQDGERPAAGERRAEHFRADQNRRRDDGDDAWPDDLARGGSGGLRTHIRDPVVGGNLSENAPRGKRQWTKKVASRVIVPMPCG